MTILNYNRIISRFLILLFVLLSTNSFGQYINKKKRKDFLVNKRTEKPIYHWTLGNFETTGIHFSVGPTYYFTKPGIIEGQYVRNSEEDNLFYYSRKAKGKIMGAIDVGMIHITKKPRKYIHYYDWGVGIKYFGGKEENNFRLTNSKDSLIGQYSGKGQFSFGYITGRFDVHSIFQMSKHLFLDQSLGINIDADFLERKTNYEGFAITENEKYQSRFMAQLHYFIGFGVKPDLKKGFYFISGFELPVFGTNGLETGLPFTYWFSSKYYPAMLRFKFVWLFKKDPNRCPPVEI